MAAVETQTVDPETVAPMSFQEAFTAAKSQLAAPAPAIVADKADDDDPADEPDEPEPDADEPPAPTAKPSAKGGDSELITDDEFKALQVQHADDPVALKKSLLGAFTKKTQAIAAERQTYEAVKEYVPLIEAYKTDPAGVVARLAEANGFEVVRKGEARPAATTAAAAPSSAEELAAVVEQLRTSLGPDLEYLAEGLAPALLKLTDARVNAQIETTVAPLRKQTDSILGKAAEEAASSVMQSFTKAHPDYQEHEPAMLALAQKMDPKGMTEAEFLETLYSVVTRQAWETNRDANIAGEVTKQTAAAVKKALARMTSGAEGADTLRTATPDKQVKKRPAGPVSFEQAAQDARNGIQYEDED